MAELLAPSYAAPVFRRRRTLDALAIAEAKRSWRWNSFMCSALSFDFGSKVSMCDGPPRRLMKIAASKGAIGAVMLFTPSLSKLISWERLAGYANEEGLRWVQKDGKPYSECSFCRASCPSRDFFIEPDSGLPLKCDMCEDTPPLAKPKCVEWCVAEALVYEEREEEVDEPEPAPSDVEIGLEALIDKHGLQQVLESLARVGKP